VSPCSWRRLRPHPVFFFCEPFSRCGVYSCMRSYILRRLLHSPTFTATSLITIAVAIGANTGIFSVVNSILLKPLPFPGAERLVGVWQIARGIGVKDLNASPATYFTYREESRTFEDIGLWDRTSASVTGSGEPERVDGLEVTDG